MRIARVVLLVSAVTACLCAVAFTMRESSFDSSVAESHVSPLPEGNLTQGGKPQRVDRNPKATESDSGLNNRGSTVSSVTDSNKQQPAGSIEDLLLFFPNRFPDGNWARPDLAAEDCKLEAADGTQLHAWYFRVDEPKAYILYMHGNAGNVAMWADAAEQLRRELQASVLLFDYRGYGRSEGTPTIDGIFADARAAHSFLLDREKISSEEILLWGRSLGGAVAVDLAARLGANSLVLESTFSSLRDVASAHYPATLVDWLVRDQLNSVRLIANYRGPVLQSHGTMDATVPIGLGRRLFDAAPGRKQFFTLRGAHHNSPTSPALITACKALLHAKR